MDDCSKNIKKLREKMMLTQEEFANVIGVSFQTVNRWENGKHEPTLKTKRKIVKLSSKFTNEGKK